MNDAARKARAPKAKDFEPGQRVSLYGNVYKLWKRSARSWLAFLEGGGNMHYRIGPKHVAHMKEVGNDA